MFLLAFIMFLLFSLSTAASTPAVKRSTHTSSHHAIAFVLIFVVTLVVLILFAFIVYRFIIKRCQSNVSTPTPTPTFVPRSFVLRTDTSSNQSTDLEKGTEGQKAPIGPISSPILLFGTGAIVFNPDSIRGPRDMKEMDITDTPRSTDKIILRYIEALSDAQETSESPGIPDELREMDNVKHPDKDRLSLMTIVACSIETELDAQDDTRDAPDSVKSHDEIRMTASPITVCHLKIDTTLVDTPDNNDEKVADTLVRQSLSLSKRDIFVIDDDDARSATAVTETDVETFGSAEANHEIDAQHAEAQNFTLGSTETQSISQYSSEHLERFREGHADVGLHHPDEQHSPDTTLVTDPVEADTTLIDTVDCNKESDAHHDPTSQHANLARRDIFVINDEKGSDGPGLTEKVIEGLGNVEESCNKIIFRAEARAMTTEFQSVDCLEEEEYLTQRSATTEAETGLSGSLSSSFASLNIQDLVNPMKPTDTRGTYSLAQAEEEQNAIGHLTSAFSMSDVSDNDTPPTHRGDDADSPTYPRKGYLQPSRSMFASKEDARAFLWRCRVDMQRDPDIRILVLNPVTRDSGSYDRATMPAYHAPELSITQESMRKEIRCSAKRSSVMAYRPALPSPLAADSDGCGLLRSKSFSRWPVRLKNSSSSAPLSVSDNNSASELLVNVLRRLHSDGVLTKRYSEMQQLVDDDIFWSEAAIRPESPLFFEHDPMPLFFNPEVIDPFSRDPNTPSFYSDDVDVEPVEVAPASWFADSVVGNDEALDGAMSTVDKAASDMVCCEDADSVNHDPSRSDTVTSSLLEPGMRPPSTACARMPTVIEEAEQDTLSSSLPSSTTAVNPRGDSVKISPPSNKKHSKPHCSRARSTLVSTNITPSSAIDRLPYGFPSPPVTTKSEARRGPATARLTHQKSITTTCKRVRSFSISLSTECSAIPAGSLEGSRPKRRSLSDISNPANTKSSGSTTATGRSRSSSVSSPRPPSVGHARKSSSSTKPIKNSPPPRPPPQNPLPPIPQRRQRSDTLSSPSITTRDATSAIKKPFRI
ncbi:uncharacterized protein FOMMEDRAFT_26245 [Fomitiporia mediterranea MF3/22]|uniref:uncharacterized protein n=1 Tax=Fomitiporia mediterranea (strain MF3/22) TaxID=694068 RepID=UPI0004409978|nr:uncharacterized protein FOMMEDRAFT_26245 [Fomitiporia mediterranea MF3/22]EJD07161.1 hypothetical protein FOMMEDRAFT_26245 [Fomitiporia mediterranea MF3/22]